MSYTATIKRKARDTDIQAGISQVQELESPIAPELAQAMLQRVQRHPDLPMLPLDPATTPGQAGKVLLEMQALHPAPLFVFASFTNLRHTFAWHPDPTKPALGVGVVVEVDETTYAFGRAYEIEVESTEPEMIKDRL